MNKIETSDGAREVRSVKVTFQNALSKNLTKLLCSLAKADGLCVVRAEQLVQSVRIWFAQIHPAHEQGAQSYSKSEQVK